MTDYQYFDPYLKEQERQQQRQQLAEQEKNKNDGFFGDLIDSVQRGFYQSIGGDAEAVGQVSDSNTFKAIGRDLSKRADAQTGTMTPESQQALTQRLFTEDENGDLAMGDGITDWRTWGLQFGTLSGQVLGMVGLGGGVGAVAKGAGKLALRAVAKEAMTKEAQQLVAKSAVKEAIRNGALSDVRGALIEAPTREAMDAVLNNATKRLSAIGATAAAGAMGAGMRAQQTRDEYMGLDAETLNQNPAFQDAYWQLADMPENQGLDTATLHNAAKEMLAEKAATTSFFDKKALLSDFASGALGGYVGGIGGVLGNAAKGSSRIGNFAKGAVIEGGTEAWQGGETQRAVNEAIREWGYESRDPMAGVLSTRFEEGLLGGVFGGAVKVFASPDTQTKPIVTVEAPTLTGNSLLDGALAQSAANEQSRYGELARGVDAIKQRSEGVMRPFDNPVAGNPDEPAFLRSRAFNPTGRDLTGEQDIDINSPVQQALIRSQRNDASAEAQLADAINGGDQGKTLYETTLNDEGLVPESRRLPNNGVINLGGTPGDGINSAYIPPIVSRPDAPQNEIAPTTAPLEMATLPEGGAAAVGVMKATNSQVTGNPDEPAYLRQANISDTLLQTAQQRPVTPTINDAPTAAQEAGVLKPRQKTVSGDPDEPAYLRQANIIQELSTLRVTKKGNPFATQKEAQLASRPTETPIALPTGGFGVVDKAELEQAKSNINQLDEFQQYVNDHGFQPVDDVNDKNASDINQPADSAIKNVLGVKTEKQSNNDGSSTYRFSFNDGHASVLTHSDGTAHIMDVQIGDGETAGLRGKGVGTKLYEHIGNELAKDGVILESTRWSKHRSAISPAALRVWEKLEKAGTATVVGNENARVLDRFSGVNEVRDIPIYEFTGNKSSTNQSTVNQHGVNESASNQVVAQNQPNINVNDQVAIKQTEQPIADQAAVTPSPDTVTPPVVATDSQPTAAPSIDDEITEAIVEHTTGKGKVLRGVVRTGLTVAQAKAIDPYTFKKDGGHFIREQHLDKLSGVKAETSITAEPEAENDATFTPRDGWETNLQAAREYANHLRKAGKISEQDALKAWNSTESLAKLIKQIEVVQTPVVGHGDDAITLDQLKQLRVDIINKINQQEADNRSVDDRLMRKKGQLDKAIDESEQAAKKEQRPNFADMPEINNAETESLAQELGLMVADGKTMEATKKLKSWQAERDPKGKMANWEQQAIIDRAKTIADNIKSQPKRGGDPQPDPEPTKDRFADNKLFTADRVAAARARMKSKIGNLNSGLDPEMLVDGMTIAGAYIESGVRNFTTYTKAMTDDFGDGIKPFLLSFWEGARNYPGLDTKGMTSVEDSAKQHAELASNKPAQASKADTPPTEQPVNRDRQILRDSLHEKLGAGESINNNNDLKRIAAELLGVKTSDLSTMQLKEAQEAYEAAAVRHRRDAIVDVLSRGNGVHEAFQSAVEAYEGQPNLDVRTAKSSDLQAYSTPTPMALLANLAAGAWAGKTVFEPTAGNGLLLLTADAKTTYSNELDPDRADSLAWSGFNVTIKDATNNPLEGMVPEKVDSVLANPPFGKYRDEAGKPAKVEFSDPQGRTHVLGEIDHIIAKNALDAMKDDGKATLILGAPKDAGIYTGNNKAFLNYLYSNYNVVHHIEAEGALFNGQGAGWPTQMIVIHGRSASGTGKYAPIKGEVQRLATWDAIYDSFKEKGLLDTKGSFDRSRSGTGDVRTAYEPAADRVGRAARPDGFTAVPVSGSGDSGSAKSDSTAGDAERFGQRGRSAAAAGTLNSQPDLGKDGLGETESASTTTRKSSGSRAKPDDMGLSGQRNDRPVGRTVQAKALDTKVDKANEFQATYKTASGGINQGVLTPLNMASYTQKALMDIQERHGSVDGFVADRLGYPSTEALHGAFMGLQADAVALGVDAIEQGRAIIIGDQTGVGKGRQAAGMIRYALQKGMIPIFVTQKPNLFTDMYDDLADIGVTDFTPLIMNDENGFVTKTDKATDKVVRLFNHSASKRAALLGQVRSTGKLPDGFNGLFLTYSQISNDNNGSKAAVLSSIMENAMLIMDESHTAAGDSNLGRYFKGAVQSAKGVTYLSATYAKRPDNMGLYIRTDLGLAVDNFDRLQSIINNGGLGMQIYIAGKLAEAGQMVRRERSFDGIEIRNRVMTDKTGKTAEDFDQVTEVLRGIQDLSRAWRFYVENELSDQIQMESGLDTRIAGNQADTKINVTLFSSVVHNYIAQLSLGLKAKLAAQQAITSIKEGKRPVIAVENTMGSALDTFMERNNLRMGDSANGMSYTSLLRTIADDVLSYSVKEPGTKKGRRITVKIDDVSDGAVRELYQQVMDLADSLRVDVPASPIDAIRHEVEKAGYTVAEITGRDRMVDYGDNAKITYRPAVEDNRRAVVDRFNNNDLDVLILNQAGSTGLSLHASEKFRDQKPRHMIVAQPSLDINTFMQMLGRINRTGQVVLPTYDLLWLDLPSEKRPAAILSRKMSSLNANTSGNTESATSVESVDLLNPYGNQVVSAYMAANRDMLASYSASLLKEEDDQAAYFLGKLAVVPSAAQKQIIEQIEAEYKELIDYLDATGQNELNMTEVDLDAKALAQRLLTEGRKDAGVFSEPAYITQVDAKAQGRAPKWDEVKAELAESSQAEFDDAVAAMMADQDFEARLRDRIAKAEKDVSERKAKGKKYDQEEKEVTALNDRLTEYLNDRRIIERQFSTGGMYAHGAAIRVKLPDADHAVTGIVTGLTYDHTSGNPAAPSKWRMRVLLADRTRNLPLSLSRAREGIVEGPRQDTEANLKAVFDRAAEMPSRETRYIMTGNLVAAQDRASERGRIIPFTTQDGRVIQGMLMPKKFDPNGGVLEKVEITPASGFEWLSKTKDRVLASLGLRTTDNQVVVRRNYNGSGYAIEMPKAVSKGKRYWGAPEMTAIIGEQAVKGNGTFSVQLTEDQAKQVIKVMQGLNPLTLTDQLQIKDYQAMRGVKTPEFSSANIRFSKQAQAGSAGKGMKQGDATLAAKEWLRQFKTDITVKVAKDQAEFARMLADAGQSDQLSADDVGNAAYLPGSKTLLLNAAAIESPARLRELMRHEILGHHGLSYVIGRGAFNDILKMIMNGYTTSAAIRSAVDKVNANYANIDGDTFIHEVFAHYAENRPVDKGALGRMWDRVVAMVKAALVKAGFIRQNEAEQQMDALLKTIAENMRQGRTNNDPNGGPGGKPYFSKTKNGDTSAYGQAGSLLKESGSSLVNWLKQQRGRGLGTLTDLQIDQIYRDVTGGAVSRYQKLRTKMESDRNDILLEAETKYDPMWEALPEKEKAALSQLMHDATMSRLHPDRPLEENSLYQEIKAKLAGAKKPETKAAYQAELDVIENNYRQLSERYRLSSKQSKALYATMRDLYAKQWDKLRDAITQRIEDQMGEGGKALASKMRLRMEHALQHGPYFPLARFGDYVVKARKGDEYIREHFEKRKDAEAALKQYRGEGYDAVMTVKETRAGDQANAHALGMEVMELLDKAGETGANPEGLKDAVWQAMLDMLPDASYAKHAIHRKRIKGASRDGHRAYLQSVYHYAHHISKIRYGHQMKAELDGMKEQVQAAMKGEDSPIKTDDVEIAQQVLNEMNLRHEMNMNPKGSALAGQLGNLGFLFYLGASPASAMVNLTQNITVMLPQLAGKYGFVKAAKFMLKAMADYLRHGVFKNGTKEAWVSLTRATNAAITADEKAMLNRLYKAGVLDLTQAHSIASRADTDQQNVKPGKQWARTGMRWAGALFHNAEVLNREVAALTAYRLMKEQQPGIASAVLKGDSGAIDQVAEMVYDGHGNYAASNRPRYMRGDVMKVLTQFKIYSQMMTYTLARNAVQAAKGDKAALKTLGAMFGTTWMMAGMMGMPTPVGLIMYGLASLFDDDDDRSGEASFRLGLTEVFGADVGELIAKGPVDAMTGLNISGRTGLSDLWWRSPKEGVEGDDLTFHYVQQIAGPVLGIGVSAVRGMREFANGDVQRGVEAMAPKAVKDLAKAYRQASEGEQTRNGDSVIDDVDAWHVASQAMGFSSADMAKIYSAREYIKGKEKIIEERRANLLADYFTAMREQDTDAMQDVMDNIREFNASHNKAEAITGKTLKQSIKSRERSGERTQAGTYLSSKREYLRSEGAFLSSLD